MYAVHGKIQVKTNHGQKYKDKMKELQSQPHTCGKRQKRLDSIVNQVAQSRAGPKIEYYAKTSSRHREMTEGLVEMITQCMLPLNIVDMPGFRKCMLLFDGKYDMPSRRTITRQLTGSLHALKQSMN